MTESWKPAGSPALSPYLICRNAEAEIAFLARAFGGHVARRVDKPDGSLSHAEIRIGNSVVMLGGGGSGAEAGKVHLHLYVPDVDAAWRRAVEAGGRPVQLPERKHATDNRRGGIADAEGVTWWLATQ
jgi:PhnB protein